MNADVKGALNQLDRSYKAFVHNGKPMAKHEVKKVLEYALAKGYEHTGQLSDKEIDSIVNPIRARREERLDNAWNDLGNTLFEGERDGFGV